ncbi:MAG: hypothetical protein EBR02_09735, partial [Alphaproteobacteria bacterium]|nr:hypothetical protein [Alphaproteobacteria bacterium]
MLGGSSRVLGNGYLQLIEEMAKKGLIKLDTSDMVMGEFLGVCGPIYAEDIKGDAPRFQEKNVQLGYALRHERYKVLKRWVDEGLITIHKTRCGDEYLDRIQKILQFNPQLHIAKYSGIWPISAQQLHNALLSPASNIARAVKGDALFADKLKKHKLPSGSSDRGEISLADTLKEIQEKEGIDTKSFILFEGTDVRGRIIWRLKEPENDQLVDPFPERYNPNADGYSLSTDEARALGNINFVSTKGFLAGLAYAGMTLDNGDRQAEKRKFYITAPDEASSMESFNAAYNFIIGRVNEKGLSRSYKIRRDEAIDRLTREESSYDFQQATTRQEPWREFVDDLLKNNREQIQSTIADFVKHRDGIRVE